MFNQYPYLNLNDLNLDYLLNEIKRMYNDVTNFVSINAIKYADPIQWNITSQYEKNTVVIDPVTGTAYISVAPVPAGIALSRDDYWTVVFDLSMFITQGNKNITEHVETAGTIYSTFALNTGDWVVWNGELYKALDNLPAGTAYSPNYNIERVTVEEYVKNILNAIDTEVQARIDADGALSDRIDDEVQARQDADGALSDRIDDEVQARQDADGGLSDRINDEAQARQDADRAIEAIIGNLNDLETTAKDDIVAAINEVNEKVLGAYDTADIRNYGGVGDGVANDTQAFNDCMAANGRVYLPIIDSASPAVYVLDSITLAGNNNVVSDFGATIKYNGAGYLFTIKGSNIKIVGVTATFTNNGSFISIENTTDTYIREIILNNIVTYGALHFIDDTASTSDYVSTYIDTVECKGQNGRCLNIHHSFAFLLIKDLTSDATGRSANANFTHFWFENSAGMQLSHVEAEGGLVTAYDQTNGGFYFKNCQAVWLDKCLADTCAGPGFYQDTGCQYFYISNCAASLCCGFGFLLNGSRNQFTGCWVIGRKGMAITQVGAHGVNSYSDYTNIDNVMIFDVNGTGIAIQKGRHLIGNVQVHNSTAGIGNTAQASGYIHDCDVSDNDTQVSPIAPMLYKDIFNGTTLWSNVT